MADSFSSTDLAVILLLYSELALSSISPWIFANRGTREFLGALQLHFSATGVRSS